MDQSQLLIGVVVWRRSGIELQRWEGEDSSSLPLSNGRLNLRVPHEVRLVRSGRAIGVWNLHIIVRATDLVLGAVAAEHDGQQVLQKDGT